MAETGKIAEMDGTTSGSILRDIDATPPYLGFNNYSGTPPLAVDVPVSYDVIETSPGNYMATNVTIITPVVDPTYPKNSDYPGATIINTPVTGNVTVASNTTTIIEGAIISGEVIVQDNATLVFKSSNPSDINSFSSATRITNVKTRDANNKPTSYYTNPTLIMWGSKTSGNLRLFGHKGVKITNSDIGKDAFLTGGSATPTFTSTIGKSQIKGAADLKSFKGLQINDLKVSKNINLSTNTSLMVNTLASETGSIQLNSNPSAIYSNVNVVRSGTANAIRTDGCVAILSAEAI